MKNLALVTFFLALTFISYTQITFTIKSSETCWWSDYTEDFSSCSETVFDNSVFVMNENEDMLIHKTSEMTSTYYVTETEVEEDFVTYSVTSDVGNNYIVIFDIEKMLIKFVGTDVDGNMYINMYKIKSVF